MQRYRSTNASFRLMDNSVMVQMNFKGHGCKLAFGQTKVFKIVISVYLYFRNVLYGLRDCGRVLQLPVSSLN